MCPARSVCYLKSNSTLKRHSSQSTKGVTSMFISPQWSQTKFTQLTSKMMLFPYVLAQVTHPGIWNSSWDLCILWIAARNESSARWLPASPLLHIELLGPVTECWVKTRYQFWGWCILLERLFFTVTWLCGWLIARNSQGFFVTQIINFDFEHTEDGYLLNKMMPF